MRGSNFSLEFLAIEPSVFVEAIRNVLLCDESFVWLRESGVFAKLREVGVGCVCMVMVIHHSWQMSSKLENRTASKIETHGCVIRRE